MGAPFFSCRTEGPFLFSAVKTCRRKSGVKTWEGSVFPGLLFLRREEMAECIFYDAMGFFSFSFFFFPPCSASFFPFFPEPLYFFPGNPRCRRKILLFFFSAWQTNRQLRSLRGGVKQRKKKQRWKTGSGGRGFFQEKIVFPLENNEGGYILKGP